MGNAPMQPQENYLAPQESARQISRWTVLLVTVFVTASAAVAVGILREQAARNHKIEILLMRIQGHTHRLNALEWQVAGEQKVSPKVVVEMQQTRDKTMRSFSELEGIGPGTEKLKSVFETYRRYEAAVDEELRLLSAGKLALAKSMDREQIDPGFRAFSNSLAMITEEYSAHARQRDRSAFALSTFIFLAAVFMVGLLFWRFERARQSVELMAAEQGALRWSEKRFRSLIQNASDVILLLDPESVISYASASVHRTLGYPPEELTGTSLFSIICPDDVPHVRAYLGMCVGNPGLVQVAELCFLCADGSTCHLEVIGNNRLDDASVRRIVLNCRDVTERRLAETELRSSREQLRNLSAYLQSMREEERKNIAREIHDELGQALTALKMDASWLAGKYSDHALVAEKTNSMADLIDATIRTVKRICTELRPGVLDDLGLIAAIEWQAEEFERRTGIRCEVNFHPDDLQLDSESSTTIFRILQEALTNVIRHAEATGVQILLERRDNEVMMSIEDNGKGIAPDRISDPESFGLIGIRERAGFLGGEVNVQGKSGKGTILTVRLPFRTAQTR